ncbi:MAG: hypothetical protein HQ521_04030 [Bacteroidetes bacterium]|nr:hypothetical protein [Bacteroidota bacterium]
MKFIDKSKFDFSCVQDGSIFCIPASMLCILKYYDVNITETQFTLMIKMVLSAPDRYPSFKAAVNGVGPCYLNIYTFEQLFPQTFDDWLKNIKDDIDLLKPIAIATRNSNGVHIRTIYGYDDAGKRLHLFNTGINSTTQIFQSQNNVVGAVTTINSGIEVYSYTDAEADWNSQYATKDQLSITKI